MRATLREEPVPRWVVASLVLVVAGVGVVLTSVGASVFGDGSAYLTGIVGSGHSVGIPGRVLVSAIRDAPVLVAMGSGETNLRVLSIAQSVGYILVPVALWVAALIASSRDRARFVIVAICCGLCVGILGFFSVSELFPALALAAFASTSLASPAPLRAPQAIAVAASATVLIAAHEAAALCALVLVVHGAARAWARLGRVDLWASVWVSCAGVATIAWALRTWLTSPNGNADGFRDALVGMTPPAAVLAVASAVVLVGWLMSGGLAHGRRVSFLAGGLVVALTGLAVAGVALVSGPGVGYRGRVWCLLAVVLGQAALGGIWWARRRWPEQCSQGIPSGSMVALAVFVPALMIMPLANTGTWLRGVSELRAVVDGDPGLLSPEDSMSPEGRRILWGWTNPSLSVVVRGSVASGVMLDQAEVWKLPDRYAPFEPSRMQSSLPPQFTWR